MQFIVSGQAKQRAVVLIFMLIVVALLLGLCIFLVAGRPDQNAAADADTVRCRLLTDALGYVGAVRPQDAVAVWAKGLMERNAAMQYAVMGTALKKQYAQQLEKNAPNWVTGVSSPWVESVNITRIEKTDDRHGVFFITVSTAASTGPAGTYNAVLTVEHIGDFWQITEIAADPALDAYTGFSPVNASSL